MATENQKKEMKERGEERGKEKEKRRGPRWCHLPRVACSTEFPDPLEGRAGLEGRRKEKKKKRGGPFNDFHREDFPIKSASTNGAFGHVEDVTRRTFR